MTAPTHSKPSVHPDEFTKAVRVEITDDALIFHEQMIRDGQKFPARAIRVELNDTEVDTIDPATGEAVDTGVDVTTSNAALKALYSVYFAAA